MTDDRQRERLIELFADILDYPTAGIADKAAECEALLGTAAPTATALMAGFRDFAGGTPLGKLEEIYSGFFDLNPLCHPYVGYQLFGENYKRSSFLLGLKERFHAESFQPTPNEIPDRLSIVLRFVAHTRDREGASDLVLEGVLPALERMTSRPECSDHDHDAHSEFDGDTGVERKQLDGHSHGEVLNGGFLLKMIEDDDHEGNGEERPHPYHQALEALRVALQRVWQREEVRS